MKKILLGFIGIGLFAFVGCDKDDEGTDTTDSTETSSHLNVDRYYFDRSVAKDIIKQDSVVLLTKNGKSNPTNFPATLSFQSSLNGSILNLLCDTLIVGEDFEQIKFSLEGGYNINFTNSLNLFYANGDYKREENQISFSGVFNYSGSPYDDLLVERLFIKENNQYVAQVFGGQVLVRDETGNKLMIIGFYFVTEPTIESVSKKVSSEMGMETTVDSVYFRKSQIPFVLED